MESAMESEVYASEEKEVWQIAVLQNLFPGDLAVELGRLFLARPYKAGTLEGTGRERLVVNLDEFDCTTFVESVLALVLYARGGDLSPSVFGAYLKLIRYRDGKIDGYASRLHYFNDWLRDNQKKKILVDLTRGMGGKPVRKKINYMTMHSDLYTALRNKNVFEKMLQREKSLSRKTFYVIDSGRIASIEAKIENGDIIAFTSDEEGLDVAHLGFAIRQGKTLKLLHASGKEGEVVVSRKTLAAFLKANKKFTGFIVARFA
jgi:hypothetical protein